MKKGCFNNDMKYFEKPIVCENSDKNINKVSPIEMAAQCPPMGEPKLLTMVSPVVFDECGINLCRTINLCDLQNVCLNECGDGIDILFDGLTACDLANAYKIQLQVVDIDFNFVDPQTDRYSEILPAKNQPNLSRITLKDIDVTFAVTVINNCCQVAKQGMMTIRYLGENCCCKEDRMNPSCISFDLYTPYGISYGVENPEGCNKLVPTINFMGFINGDNNSIQQGVSAQALAKVVATGCDTLAIGLTLYFKSIYFVQYKFEHQGLTVPPRLKPASDKERNISIEFVKGELLAPCIKPLDVGEHAKCPECCEPCIPACVNSAAGCQCNCTCDCTCQCCQCCHCDPCQCVVKCPVCHCNPCQCGCTHNCNC